MAGRSRIRGDRYAGGPTYDDRTDVDRTPGAVSWSDVAPSVARLSDRRSHHLRSGRRRFRSCVDPVIEAGRSSTVVDPLRIPGIWVKRGRRDHTSFPFAGSPVPVTSGSARRLERLRSFRQITSRRSLSPGRNGNATGRTRRSEPPDRQSGHPQPSVCRTPCQSRVSDCRRGGRRSHPRRERSFLDPRSVARVCTLLPVTCQHDYPQRLSRPRLPHSPASSVLCQQDRPAVADGVRTVGVEGDSADRSPVRSGANTPP